MKSSELHKWARKNGWKYVKAEGSHYIYEKKGKYYPFHFKGPKK